MRLSSCLIAACAALPALTGCSSQPAPPPPLSQDALGAVSADPGAPTEELARAIDEAFTADVAAPDPS